MKLLLKICIVGLPWRLRRWCLMRCFGYEIDATARIGWAWIFPRRLQMGPRSQIGHGTVAVHLDEIRLEESAGIGRLTWITGFPSGTGSAHFGHVTDRVSRLWLEPHAAITNRHLIDCTCEVRVGAFATVAGFRSQVLTHSIDVVRNRQDAQPIAIGPRSFVGTGCILLGGARLPACSVLGAGSVLNKAYEASHTLYAGQPARPIKPLDPGARYFQRESGFVE